ncbi:MAG: ABC transporter permease [Beijerinckiaceae bacterium]|nr:ABC transporter permease [Beijerinckiaceae bacterium]
MDAVKALWDVAAPRLWQALITGWLLATLCFAFTHALPGDVALRVAAARIGDDRVTAEAADRIRQEEGLGLPVLDQYGAWMMRLVKGDLGRSLVSGKPVLAEIIDHGRYTLMLGTIGWLLSYLLALPIGFWAGWWPGGAVDRLSMGLAVVLASLPTFLVGIGLISAFALTLHWLPPAGFRTGAHMILPALTLALGLAAYSVRIVRNAVVEVRQAFYLTYARIRGHSATGAFRHHGIRNAAIPIVTFAALQFAYLVDGFVIVETLFNYPGLGDLLVRSLLARDVPVVVGAALLIGWTYAFINLAADLTCLKLDPRRSVRDAA